MTSKKKLDLPFKIVESEVSGGFIDNIHNSFTGGIDLANLHEDKYGNLDEAVLQSPFTQQWVGGKSHRHVNLNTGSDSSVNRPEAFHTEFVADGVRFYSHNRLNSPPAYWTRDGLAKRPLNIANVRNNDLYVGNYSKGYQVLQTSGRRITNNLIVDGFEAGGSLTTQFVRQPMTPLLFFTQDGTPLTSSGDGDPFFDALGASVSINSDGTVVAAGSRNSDNPSNSDGSVIIFKSSSLGWYQDGAPLTSSDGSPGSDILGYSVSINSDGTIVAAGSQESDSPSPGAGSVVVFKSSSLGWYQDGTPLTSSGDGSPGGDALGSSVSINSDGTVVAAGSIRSDNPASAAGSVIIFKSSSLGWYQDGAPLTSSGDGSPGSDILGYSVSINSDGTIVAAGSPNSDYPSVPAGEAGSVVVFKSSSLGWYQDGTPLTSSGDGFPGGDLLGISVSINSDGTIVAAGSPTSDNPTTGAGSVVVFKSSSLGWYQDGASLTSSGDTDPFSDALGSSVSINSDGTVVAAGSQNSDNPSGSAGSVIIFKSSSLGWYQDGTPLTSNGDTDPFSDALGTSVSINSDGTIVAAGSPSSDEPASGAGSVIIFTEELLLKDNDYLFPDLTRTGETVIVERFSAPGSKEESSRGALDREGEEMSPNIPLPWRSYKTRKPFYEQLSERTPQGGGSIHGVNRNRISRAGNELVDNGFLVRSLPGTDIQYSWITASALTTADDLGGYQNFAGAYNRSEAYTDINFISGSYVISGSTEYLVDNRFINSLVKDSKVLDIENNIFSISSSLSASLSEYVNTPYTFTTWTSIRTGETALARLMRKRNILSVQDEQPEIISTTGGPRRIITRKRGDTSTNYTEPPVTFKYRPLVHKFIFKGNTTKDLAHNVIHTYVNNLSTFANKDLLLRLKSTDDKGQFYNLIYNYYTNPDAQEGNPIERLVRYTYKEIVWPKEENTGLDRTRTRAAYYLDRAGFTRDGFDIQLGKQRAFWRDEQADRKRSDNTAGGYYSSMNYLSTEETGSDFTYNSIIFNVDNKKYIYSSSLEINSLDNGLFNSISVLEASAPDQHLFDFSGSIKTGDLFWIATGYDVIFNNINKRSYIQNTAGEFNTLFTDFYENVKDEQTSYKKSIGSLYRNTSYKWLLTNSSSTETYKIEEDSVSLNPKLKYVSFLGGVELNNSSYIEENSTALYDSLSGFPAKITKTYLTGSELYVSFDGTIELSPGGQQASWIAKYDLETGIWDNLGGGPSLDPSSEIRTIIKTNGFVCIGGVFVMPDNTLNVAKWDGTNWTGIAQGLGTLFSTSQTVNSFYYDNVSGNLLAGGNFNFYGDGNYYLIARIDLSLISPSWGLVAGGLPQSTVTQYNVNDIILHSGVIHIGGDFPIGASYNVAKLTTTDIFTATWTNVGTLIATNYADLLFSYGGTLYRHTLGEFSSFTTTWNTLTSPIGALFAFIEDAMGYGGNIYAVGAFWNSFLDKGGVQTYNISTNTWSNTFPDFQVDVEGFRGIEISGSTAYIGGAVTRFNLGYFDLNNTSSGVQALESNFGYDSFDQNYFDQSFSQSDFYFSTLDNGLLRQTEEYSGKKPFFDSYEDYIEDARSFAKDYSTIPEFKISDHIEYYIKDNNKNFRSTNKQFLLLDGQESYRSAENQTSSYNTQFFNSYATSDLMKKHDQIKDENEEVAKVDEINIKISGVKKLLPYNGFYPQDRTVQLANLYNEYAKNNLDGGVYNLTYQTFNSFEEEINTGETTAPSSIDVKFFNNRYYMALGYPEYQNSGLYGKIVIYRTYSDDPQDWNPSVFHTWYPDVGLINIPDLSFGSCVRLIDQDDYLYLFTSQYYNISSSADAKGYLKWSTIDKTNAVGGINAAFIENGQAISGALDGRFGRYFDIVHEKEAKKIIMSIASPFSGAAGPGSSGRGEGYILTASLEAYSPAFSDKIYIGNGDISNSRFGSANTVISCSSGYQAFFAQIQRASPDASGSVWVTTSTDGATWTPKVSITRDAGPGYGGDLKAVEFKNKTYVFYSTPLKVSNFASPDAYKGAAYVISSSIDCAWPSSDTDLDKVEIYKGEQFQLFPDVETDFFTQNIGAFANEESLFYVIADSLFGGYFLEQSLSMIVAGQTEDGINWQTKDNDNILIITQDSNNNDDNFKSVAVSTIQERGISYPIFYTNKIQQGQVDFDIFSFQNRNYIDYSLNVENKEKFHRHASLEPFFTPGILYNTIKSGIAVDWPCTTGSDTSIVPYGNNTIINSYYPKSIEMESFLNGDIYESSYGQLRSSIDYRIPFENIIFPNEAFISKDQLQNDLVERTPTTSLPDDSNLALFLIGTYIYGGYEPYISPFDFEDINSLGPKRFSVPFVYRKNNGADTGLYTLGMSNFLAETVKFFLKDQKMTTFVSDPDYKWKEFNSNKTYYMDIVLEKSEELVMMEAYHSDKHPTGSNGEKMNGRYFGYPVNKTEKDLWAGATFTEEEGKLIHNDPAYAPYTPPYFEGEARARISFKPESDRAYSVQEIFDKATVENIFLDVAKGATTGSDAYINKMPIVSSLDIFGSAQAVEVTIDERTGEQVIRELQDSQNWIISPRMETPVLDFASQSLTPYENNYSKTSGFGRGMWSGYGEIPKDGKGVKIRLEYPFSTISSAFTASLLDQIGLKTEEKNVGLLAEAKTISEAIIAIPYLDVADEKYTTFNSSGFNFIKIDRQNFVSQYRNFARGEPAVPANSSTNVANDIESTTITDMIDAMQDYVIPPEFNFLQYEDIHPFVMYIFEFEHTLDRQDLADIWQGLMPKISQTAEHQDITISHRFGKFEFFEGKELPENLKWLVFKVKQKSEYNYFNVTATTKDDNRFNFNKIIGREEGTDVYSYNWPYDYFSLVELAKMEISVEYKSKKQIEDEVERGIVQEADIGPKRVKTTKSPKRVRVNVRNTATGVNKTLNSTGLGRSLINRGIGRGSRTRR